jgi:phosphatidylserine/phosphatidylglycerophosphate/cardiolipin synthase-like enzyme
MDALLDLPANLRERLTSALATGTLAPPYAAAALRATFGDANDRRGVREALLELNALGVSGRAAAAWIRTASAAKDAVPRPDLVWTGPEVPGLHARDTRQVFEDILGSAERSIWASTYTYYDGPKAFDVLARRMDERPELEVTLLINIARKPRDTRAGDELITQFAHRFWSHDWPGDRRPRVFFDPSALKQDDTKSVLHAKALVQDERYVLVTSANFTEAALDRNIELGLRVEDPTLALQIIRHYQRLVEAQLLVPIPG